MDWPSIVQMDPHRIPPYKLKNQSCPLIKFYFLDEFLPASAHCPAILICTFCICAARCRITRIIITTNKGISVKAWRATTDCTRPLIDDKINKNRSVQMTFHSYSSVCKYLSTGILHLLHKDPDHRDLTHSLCMDPLGIRHDKNRPWGGQYY